MCKVLGLGLFFYKISLNFFFGLGPKLETDQASEPPTPPCPLNMVQRDKKWMKVGSKWKCKVGTCITACCAKWFLTKHLKEVHGLVVEKTKPGRFSTSKGSHQHQDHVKMNTHILGDAMVMQRRNDQNVVSHICAKTQCA
jgi:hypothetical protein